MRRITVVTSDYSDGPEQGWTICEDGLLINTRVVMEPNQMGINFLVFESPIQESWKTVHSDNATHYQIDIQRGNDVEHIDVEKLAHMTVWQLGEFITGVK